MIYAVIVGVIILLLLFLGWRYDRRHPGTKVNMPWFVLPQRRRIGSPVRDNTRNRATTPRD